MTNKLLGPLIFLLAGLFLPVAAFAQPIVIAALGDSLVQGYGLPADQGFVPQLQAQLSNNGANVTIINAGVSGDTSAGGLSRIEWTLTPDVDGLILSLGGNDLLRGFDPDVTRENLRQMLQIAQDRNLPTLLVGIAAPGNYGRSFKQEFDEIYPELAAEFGASLYPNFLTALLSLPDRAATMRDLMQADGIHPNAAGVALIVQDMVPDVLALIDRVAEN